jgi:Ca-activated chloride channel family protein
VDSLTRTARRAAVLSLAVLALAASDEAALDAPRTPHDAGPPEVSAPRPSFQVIGRVTDAATGAPIVGARVTIAATGQGTLTNSDGRYMILLPEGASPAETLEISVAISGYQSQSTSVRPASQMQNGFLTVDFQLQVSAVALDEPAVTGDVAQESRALYAPNAAPVAGRYALGTAAGVAHHLPAGFEREQYAKIDDNAFKSALDHPLSTFSIDVDRASYSNVRRFLLREHRLPPVDAVQVEEMVNYFPYDYALPRDGEPLGITTELGRAPWREEHLLLRIGLASPAIETAELPPSNLVFLLDVSGSMHDPDKLPLVKRSLQLIVDQMREEDRVALVVYAGAAGLVLEPTSGADKERILEAIGRLEAGGSTAGGAGLRLAYDVAKRHFVEGGNNRVILATDGDFNVGESSDAAMTRLVEERREDGTFLTILGFGTGNLQNTKMQEMAQNGNGNYAYIDGLDEARKVLVGEMGGTLLTVAKDVKIQVEFNPERVRSYRLIGYENRLLAAEDFNDDRKDAGELGAGHTVTALYEIVPVGSDSDVDTPSVDPLRYQTPGRVGEARGGSELAFVKVRYKDPDGTESRLMEHPVEDGDVRRASVDFRFASAVAGFGMLLRDSEHQGDMSVEEIFRLAESGLGSDPDGYRRGFLEMVEAYRSITEATEDDGSLR